MSPTLAILAAGMGSRYGGLKQLDPVGPAGETMLDYAVFDALAGGFRRIVFIIRRDFEAAFRSNIGRRFESHCDVVYAFQDRGTLPPGFAAPAQREKPWGTGHAVWCARRELPGSFAVINADDFYGRQAFQLLREFLENSDRSLPVGCLVGYQLNRTLSPYGSVARGVCQLSPNDRLISITEHTALVGTQDGFVLSTAAVPPERFTGHEIVSMNCWGLPTGFAPALEPLLVDFLRTNLDQLKAEFYLPAAIAELVARKQLVVQAQRTTGEWFGITYREDRARVEAALRHLVTEGTYPASLWPQAACLPVP